MGDYSRLSDKQLGNMVEWLNGTSDSVDKALTFLELWDVEDDVSAVEADLEVLGLERCRGCEWWFKSYMLDGGEEGEHVGYCDDCREQMEDQAG